jgi:RHS repeat-associated protein
MQQGRVSRPPATERVRTDKSGNTCETVTSLAFGDAETTSGTCGDPSPMHFTGKEHDYESGLDNFGARYNASTVGRFLSPDLLGGRLADPQTLNRYSYVRNNPLNFVDPTGMDAMDTIDYVCADDPGCASNNDKDFEKARQTDLKSGDPNVVRAAQAFGERNVNNGVTVSFADLSSKGENGITVSTIGTTDAGQELQADSNVTINSQAKGADLDAAVGHEGSHVADAQDVVKSGLTEGGQKIYAGENITPYTSEQHAWGVTNSILSSESESRDFSCGTSTCTLGRGVMVGRVPGIIDQILSSNAIYNVGGRPMFSTNQGQSVVNGVSQTPKATIPH